MKKDLDTFMNDLDDGVVREKAEARRLELVYRETFRGETGEEALARILLDLCFLKTLQTQEEVYKHNQALQLLRDMNVLKKENYSKIINALLTVRGGE